MKKLFILIMLIILAVPETFAYAIKVYDQMGNRLGTYRKEGENFVLYDFYDKKVENPDELIKNAPNQKTLTNFSQYFYDENMNPIGSFSTGMWLNYGGFRPQRIRYFPGSYCPMNTNYIVRPRAKSTTIEYNPYPYPRGYKTNVRKTGF